MLTNGPPDTGSFPTPRYLGKYAAEAADPGDTPERVGEGWVTCRPSRRVAGAASSGTEPSLALGVGPDGAQEVDAAEVGPEGLAEVELRLRALPQQEPAEPLLAGGADHQVGIGLALGVEVLGDVLDVDSAGELLHRDAA